MPAALVPVPTLPFVELIFYAHLSPAPAAPNFLRLVEAAALFQWKPAEQSCDPHFYQWHPQLLLKID